MVRGSVNRTPTPCNTRPTNNFFYRRDNHTCSTSYIPTYILHPYLSFFHIFRVTIPLLFFIHTAWYLFCVRQERTAWYLCYVCEVLMWYSGIELPMTASMFGAVSSPALRGAPVCMRWVRQIQGPWLHVACAQAVGMNVNLFAIWAGAVERSSAYIWRFLACTFSRVRVLFSTLS